MTEYSEPTGQDHTQRIGIVGYPEPWEHGVKYWQEMLAGDHEYDGDALKGGILLHSLTEGMKGRVQDGADSTIMLGILPAVDNKQIYYDRDNNAVIVRKDFLAFLSRLPFDEMVTLSRAGEKTVEFKGYVRDYMVLVGDEEVDHADYFREHPEEYAQAQKAQDMSSDAYQSQLHEYRSLLRNLRTAEKRNMPKETIDLLKERIRRVHTFQRNENLGLPQ